MKVKERKVVVKSERSVGTIMYVKRSTLAKLKTQAPKLGFTTMSRFLEAISKLPIEKLRDILS